jgi:hypothetical protein
LIKANPELGFDPLGFDPLPHANGWLTRKRGLRAEWQGSMRPPEAPTLGQELETLVID